MADELLARWRHRFGNVELIAHTLKSEFRDRWVRFHSLPESKRYPESEGEYAEMLRRHNTVLGHLAPQSAKLVLLSTEFATESAPTRLEVEPAPNEPPACKWHTIAVHEIESNRTKPTYWHLFRSDWVWSPGCFDRILRLVADAVVSNVMIAPLDCEWLIHPYDGGLDVILESTAKRDELKICYRNWLSKHSEGL